MDRSPKSTLLNYRTALLRRGVTLQGFCRRFGYSYHTTRAALAGVRSGPKAREIIAKVKEVSRGR